MIVWTANKEPIPIHFDDGDPILSFVATGKLFYNPSRGYLVFTKTTYRTAMNFPNIMLKVDHLGTNHIQYLDGNDCNLRRANMIVTPSGRAAGVRHRPPTPRPIAVPIPKPPPERTDASSLATMQEEGQWGSFTVTQPPGLPVPVLTYAARQWRVVCGVWASAWCDSAMQTIENWNTTLGSPIQPGG